MVELGRSDNKRVVAGGGGEGKCGGEKGLHEQPISLSLSLFVGNS